MCWICLHWWNTLNWKFLNKLSEPDKSQGYRQDRARTFNLPRHGAVMHFNGSGAVSHHLLVRASGVFVKRLIPRWNKTGNTESVCLWRKVTTVVHKRETESRNSASELLHVENTDSRLQAITRSRLHKVAFFEKGPFFWLRRCSPVFAKQTIPTEFALLYMLQLKDLLKHVRRY